MNRLEIEQKLKEIHKTFSHVYLDHEDIEMLDDYETWIHFTDGPPMAACEFRYGSQTRRLLNDWVEA